MKKEPVFWDGYNTWEGAEKAWEEGAEKAKKENPLRVLNQLPNIPGITEETKKNLKWKSLAWMVRKDSGFRLMRSILRRPFFHLKQYLSSLFQKKAYLRDGDFFLYGLSSVDEMQTLLQDKKSVLVVGFSYCEKPHECPSGRFNDRCIRDPENPVCRQCFIGKALNSLPEKDTVPLIIPTIHYIGNKIFDVLAEMKGRRVLFVITACEMTLEMFGDWGNMAGVQGIGVRLDGRICNTMKAFQLSEEGIKPGLTLVVPGTEQRILSLLAHWRKSREQPDCSL